MALEDQQPLLLEDFENGEGVEVETFPKNHPSGIDKRVSVQSELLDLTNDEDKRRRRYYRHSKDLVVAIFIVAFDTKKGMCALNEQTYLSRATCSSTS